MGKPRQRKADPHAKPLRAFVDQHGSQAAAAKTLGVGAPTLNRALQGVEIGTKVLRSLAPHIPEGVAAYLGLPVPQHRPLWPNLAEVVEDFPSGRPYAQILADAWETDRPRDEWLIEVTKYIGAHQLGRRQSGAVDA